MGRKYIPFEFKSLTRLREDSRAVSPLIAVALLVLVSVGFVVAIEGAGSDFLSSVQQPPDANVNANPGDGELRITVGSVTNADQLEIRLDGDQLTSGEEQLLTTSSGSTVVLNWDPDEESTDLLLAGSDDLDDIEGSAPQVDLGVSLITVSAVDLPDNEAQVYSYEIPDTT